MKTVFILGVTKRYSATLDDTDSKVVSFQVTTPLDNNGITYDSMLFGQSQQAGLLQYSRFPSRRTTEVVHAYSLKINMQSEV